ncbi:uncharacterized protein LOC142974917 [Anticarsia gemmatalis]|uniref:uncharacterized protein LOC142974917 n=1 Tax=Anticarsia gemmatalis TaxID=129554 RepID=UPI003F76F5C7
MILEIIIFILTTIVFYYLYTYKKLHYHFKNRGIKYLPGVPLFGNILRVSFLKKHFLDELEDVYNAFPDEKYVGFFEMTTPIILIRDPEIIKSIVVKDFDHFTDHREFFSEELDPLFSGSLLLMKGERWRHMRTTLSPAFTASKMKFMYPFLVDSSNNVMEYLNDHQGEIVDVDDVMRRYTNDVILSAGFGLQVNSIKDRDNEFYKVCRGIFDFNGKQRLILILAAQFPEIAKRAGFRLFSDKIYSFFTNITTSTMEYRKKEKVERPDMIQLLLEAKTDWTPMELAGQVFIFFTAGFETTASALVMTIHELALNEEVQEKLYQECRKFKEAKELTVETLGELKYLDAVFNESLRKWSPAIILDRVCTKSYELPPPREGGQPCKLKPGDLVYNLVNQLQMDPNYWPEPEKYDPERFLDENKANNKPFTYMPFGLGPRACIGMRFAMMELKVLMFNLIVNYKVVKTKQTMDPIKLYPDNFNIRAVEGTKVKFVKRQDATKQYIMIIEILIFLLTTIAVYYLYCYKKLHYSFQQRGIKYVPGVPLFGNIMGTSFVKKHFLEDLEEVYNAFPDEKYVGFFELTMPVILIRDPELVKNIVIKDFDHFTDHREFFSEELDPLFAGSLFLMKGDRWRHMRTTLSPAFTASKMKFMLPFLLEITNNVMEYLNEHQGEDIDVDDLMRRYSNDVIASAGFGIEVNSIRDRDNEFFNTAHGIFDFDFKQRMILMLATQFPKIGKVIKTRLFSEKIYNFFQTIVSTTMDYRRKEKVERPDMIQLLLEAKADWTPAELAGQVFIFFTAGFETSASALVMTIHELALHTEIQDKLYQDCKRFKELTFDNLSELKYLDAVINESLRKWSPAIILDRICTKTYELPPPREGGQPCVIKPGELVYNVGNQLQMDPKYWPEPHKYDPDRFLDENKSSINSFTYMPFGLGPRACIGMRFAMMELKVVLHYLIINFKIVKTPKTQDPIKLKPHNFNIRVTGGTSVQFEKRL